MNALDSNKALDIISIDLKNKSSAKKTASLVKKAKKTKKVSKK